MHRCTQTAWSKGQDGGHRLALGRACGIKAFFGGRLGDSAARALGSRAVIAASNVLISFWRCLHRLDLASWRLNPVAVRLAPRYYQHGPYLAGARVGMSKVHVRAPHILAFLLP